MESRCIRLSQGMYKTCWEHGSKVLYSAKGFPCRDACVLNGVAEGVGKDIFTDYLGGFICREVIEPDPMDTGRPQEEDLDIVLDI